MSQKWEQVSTTAVMAVVRRFPVPGGWLYDVRGEITFVPEPRQEVTGPVDLLEEKALGAPLEASPAMDSVNVGAKGLTDLINATTRLLRGVVHHDKNGLLLHECDVVHVALDNLTAHIYPNSTAEEMDYTDNLAQLVALKAQAFKKFFAKKYPFAPIQYEDIKELFDAVGEWAQARDERLRATDRQDELSEAPVG